MDTPVPHTNVMDTAPISDTTTIGNLILLPETESNLVNAEQELYDSDEDDYLHEIHTALEEENVSTTVRNWYHFFLIYLIIYYLILTNSLILGIATTTRGSNTSHKCEIKCAVNIQI
jgi:hypothetical protein